MSRVLERHEEWMGLPYPIVLLNAVEEVTDPETGEVIGTAMEDTEELAAAVALALCFMPQRLIGSEIRFIRRVLGMTGQQLAAAIEMDSATLSRWENGRQEVGAWADKAVRMVAVLRLKGRAPQSSLRPEDVVTLRLRPRDPDSNPRIEVHRVSAPADQGAGWDAVPLAA